MFDRSPNVNVRLAALEGEIRRLDALLDLSSEREPRVGQFRSPRIAKTVEKSGGTYPYESANPDTYYIRFCDSTYTLAEGDQTPTHTDRQSDYSTLAHNLTGEYIPENSHVAVFWDNGRWWIIAVAYRLRWAKAQSDWAENGTYPNGDPRVYCKSCDRDGTNVRGDSFYIYLPRNPRSVSDYLHDADPYVFTDFVIGWRLDEEGTRICATPYLHQGKIRDLKMITATTRISPGWHEADGSSQTGNSGTFNLADFVRDYQAVGGESNYVGAFPRHKSTTESIGAAGCWAYVFDALGEGGSPPVPIWLPNAGDAYDDAGDHFNCQVGQYPAEIVLFVQRYK